MRAHLRSILLAFSIAFITVILVLSHQTQRFVPTSLRPYLLSSLHKPLGENEHFDRIGKASSIGPHSIDAFIKDAHLEHQEKLKGRSHNLTAAGIKYRERRKRHPPPGFDRWVEYALANDAILVEDFFDQIYDDLRPFWGVNPATIAEAAANWDHVVSVRNGTATPQGDPGDRVPWLQLWTNLVAECARYLPDVDMPINYLDESRLLVPWVEIDRLVKIAQEKEMIIPVQNVIQTYQPGLKRTNLSVEESQIHRPRWITGYDIPYWDLFTETCSPGSPSHGVEAIKDFDGPPEFPKTAAGYSKDGYVKNVSASIDACQQPHLNGLHATFIEPISISTTKELFPLFGGCKLRTNNDIVIPGAMYLTGDPFYSGGEYYGPPWEYKTNTITWRGVGSGGRHKAENWRHFQRLRLIEMLNGTRVTEIQLEGGQAMTFQMPPPEKYMSALAVPGKIGKLLKDQADAGFVDIQCYPLHTHCDYLSDWYHKVPKKPMKDQYVSKFFVDVDGNSFSARYRALLLSTSVPIKATIYSEWHDNRLQPWLHYVPMDNTFQDLYGILDYFTRDAKGDAVARLIAEGGKKWAESTLRREDMLLYVWRLLLEFARVCNKDRDRLGYVDDLVAGSKS